MHHAQCMAPRIRGRPGIGWTERRTLWAKRGAVALLVLLGVTIAGSYLADEPLRRLLVRQMNRSLKGYTATVGAVKFHPVGLSLTVYDLDLRPGRASQIRRCSSCGASTPASSGRRARSRPPGGGLRVHCDPAVYVNLQQLKAEAADPTPLEDHGWQDAFQAIYPLKINEVRIANGKVTYVDDGPLRSAGDQSDHDAKRPRTSGTSGRRSERTPRT